jgi:predicted metal-dependent hydrolase
MTTAIPMTGSLPTRERAQKPASVTITPMRLRFSFDDRVPRRWVDDDAFLTHYMNALSIAFPDGERFFMDAVRAAKPLVHDEATLSQIRGFIAQEAMHGDAHERLNAHLREQGYPVDEMIAVVQRLLALGNGVFGESGRLAVTCGLEHVTALLGDLVLGGQGDEMPGILHATMRPLWVWHSMEETEHKGVAFDVYESAYGEAPGHYAERVAAFLIASAFLFPTVHYFQARMLRQDGLLSSPRLWARGLRKLYGRGGLLSRLVPQYIEYFRRDFHPWQHDNSALIAKWKPTLG